MTMWVMTSDSRLPLIPMKRNSMKRGSRKLRPGVILAIITSTASPVALALAMPYPAGTPARIAMMVALPETITLFMVYWKKGLFLNTVWKLARVGAVGMNTGG